MGKVSLTRDEIFLCRLASIAESSGNIFQQVDSYVVGSAIGQNNRSVDNIVRMLAQTNFIKKGQGTLVYLTANGLNLVKSLLSKES